MFLAGLTSLGEQGHAPFGRNVPGQRVLYKSSMNYHPDQMTRFNERSVALWLFSVCFLIFCMVIVGGLTRLTDSGLSITEWQPLLGAIPPLSLADWMEAFEKYRQIPEYQLVNKGMSLEEFKFIYWWEWGHRFLGRIIGVAFLVPLLYFVISRRLSRSMFWPLLGIFILGALQGGMGWYMVQSGLTERVDVSQYRLAAHLILALILFSCCFWLGLRLWWQGEIMPASGRRVVFGGVLVACIFVQSFLGALVAGTDSGLIYTTWPLMDGDFIPSGLFAASGTITDAFEHPMTIQFNHRMFAYFLMFLVLAELYLVNRRREAATIRRSAAMLAASVLIQAGLGILTLIYAVPLHLGGMHQAMAVIVLAAGLYHLTCLRRHNRALSFR